MLAVIITLTPGCRNELIDCQKAKVRISVLPIMDLKTRWNSTLELLKLAYRLGESTRKLLQKPQYAEYRPLFTTQDEWTIVRYVMEALRPFRYGTLWMTNRNTVTLHHVITVYKDMFDNMDGVMPALAKKKTQWKHDLFFPVKLPRQKRFKYYAEVSPTMVMVLISAHIFDPFWKLRSVRRWDKGMDIDPEDETLYTTHYLEADRKYVENEYCAKHRSAPINSHETVPSTNLVPSATASGSYQSFFDPYDLSSDDEE